MVTCEICGRVLKNKSGLSGHRRWVHPGEMPSQCPDNVSHHVNMESLGHSAVQSADIGRPVAANALHPSAGPEVLYDGVSVKQLSGAAIALGFKGLEGKVDHITVDGVPVKYLSDEVLKMVWKGARIMLREQGGPDSEVLG